MPGTHCSVLTQDFTHCCLASDPVPDPPVEAAGVVYERLQQDVAVPLVELAKQRCVKILILNNTKCIAWVDVCFILLMCLLAIRK